MAEIFIYTPDTTPNELVDIKKDSKEFKVFLAGTIDNGDSIDWQAKVIELTKNIANQPIGIYNPRRKKWDPNTDHAGIMKQIDWEQRALNRVEHIYLVLLDNSKSPISLLELGLFARTGKVTVFCTPKFYRYDNVLDTCNRYNIELVNNTDPSIISKRIERNAKDWKTLNNN